MEVAKKFVLAAAMEAGADLDEAAETELVGRDAVPVAREAESPAAEVQAGDEI